MKNFIVHKAKTGLLFLFFGLLAQSGWGQTAASSTWALTANANVAIVGAVSGGAQTGGSGIGAMTYGSNGVSSNGWGTTGLDANDYYQFSISPTSGNNLTISSVATTNNLSNNTATGEIQYSYSSSFTSPASIGSTFALTTTATTTTVSSLSISVANGQTLYVRVFIYKSSGNTITGSQTVRCKNFTITGTTSSSNTPSLAVTGTTAHGSVCPSSPATTQTYTITNTGTAASNVVVSSSDAQFVVSNLSSTSIGATNGTATYDVTFTPTSSGAKTSTITVYYNTSTSATTSSLTGTGTTAVTQAVTSSVATLVTAKSATLNGNVTALGVCPATTEKGFVYSITNTNNNPLVGGAGVTKTTVTLGSTGAYTLALSSLPYSTGYSYKAYVYNGTTYTYGAVQTFTTLDPLVITGTLSNGASCPNVPASAVTYTVTNNGATSISGVAVASSDAQFVVSSMSSSTIAAAGSATYTVTFTPSSSGSQTATVTVSGTSINSVTNTPTGTGTTPVTQAVSSSAATSITASTATLNGNVTTLGVCPATTEKGFVYALTSANNDPLVGGSGVTKTAVSSVVTGAYTLPISGLTQGASYSFKSYVFNGTTYTYSSVLSFTTLSPPVNDLCSNATTLTVGAAATSGTLAAASSSVNTFAYGSAKNDVWYTFTPTCSGSHTITLTFSSGPDIDIDLFTSATCPTTGTAGSVSHGSSTTETITASLTASTVYYIRVIDWSGTAGLFSIGVSGPTPVTQTVTSQAASLITTTTATLNGNLTAVGVCPSTTEKGFVYSVTSTNSDPISGGTGVTKTPVATIATGAYTLALSGLSTGIGYSFKSYVFDGTDYTYGALKTFTTVLNAPTITTTLAATSITATTASSGGQTITGSLLSAAGVVWDINSAPIVALTSKTNDGTTTSNFLSSLTSLSPQTQYYVRAYATNATGTAYGNEVNFRTLSSPATAQASGFSATATSTSNIDLSWSAATFPSTGATTMGYLLYRASGVNTASFSGTNGTAPSAGANTTLVATLTSSDITYSNSGLIFSTAYNYLLIPFTWDGTNVATYNYLTSSAPTASANTQDPSNPVITTSGTLSGLSTTYGTASSTATFSVSGVSMQEGILVTPPSGFEVSLSSGSGFASTIVVGTSGTISSTPIYVRLAATTGFGTYSGNITLSSTGASDVTVATVISTVAKKALTITGLTGVNKIYDRLTTATVTGTATYVGLVNGETFSVTGTPSFDFGTATVGTNKSITVTNYSAPSSNYSVSQPTGITANITAKELTVLGATASNKVYNGNTVATITGATLNGIVSPDVVTVNGGGTFADANVANGINVSTALTLGGADASNYSLTQPTGLTANITIANQTITALTSPITKILSDAPYSVATTATSGLTVTYATSNASVATVAANGTVTIQGVGTATITASQAGNGNYNPATSVTQSLTVNPNPSITATPTALAAFTSTSGTASTSQGFTVTGSNLIANILVTAPTGFEVSQTSGGGSGYAATQTLTQSSGAVSKVVYVRMTTLASGTPSGNVALTSSSASTVNVAVSGTVNAVQSNTIANWTFETNNFAGVATTTGSVSPETGSGTFTCVHATSSTYTVASGNGSAKSESSNTWAVGDYYQFQVATTGYSSINLAWDQVGSSTGPKNFKVQYSTTGTNGSFSDLPSASYSVLANVSPNNWTSGTNITTTTFSYSLSNITELNDVSAVYLRLTMLDNTSIAGLTVGSGGTNRIDNVIITGTPSTNPAIIAGGGPLTSLSTTYGTASSPTSFTLTGSNLSSTISIAALSGFEFSATAGGEGAYTSTLSGISATGPTTIYVRLAASANVGTYSGNIVCSSGSTTLNVPMANSTVSKATPTLLVNNTPTTYNGSTQAATATASGGGTVSNILTSGAATQTNAGTYTVTADIAASSNYNAASGVTASNSFVINKASSSITVTGSTSFIYSGSAQGPATSTVTGSSGEVSYSYSGASTTVYGPSATAPTNVGSYTVTASVAADANYEAASSSATAFGIVYPTNNWTGAISTSWNDAGNWSLNRVPLSTDNITISSGSPVLDVSHTIAVGSTLTLTSAGPLTINPGVVLTIAGTADFGDKSVILKSDATGDAAIGQVTGTLLNATSVTVERYILAGNRAWRLLTAPLVAYGSSNTTIFHNWQNNGVVSEGTGVELWGPTGTGAVGSVDSTTGLAYGPGGSIKQYGTGWSEITDTKQTDLFTTTANKAFGVFVTGHFGSGNISNGAATATTLRPTGQLIKGNVSFPISSTTHTLIGNPYASPISPSAILANQTLTINNVIVNNLFTNIWVWDPKLSDFGAYVNFDGVLDAYSYEYSGTDGTGGSYSSGTAIQSGQAFFVKKDPAIVGPLTITLKESMKSDSVTNTFRNSNSLAASIFRASFLKQTATDWMPLDGCIAGFYEGANAAADEADGKKMINTGENIGFVRNAVNLSSEHYPLVTAQDILYLKVWNTQQAHYKLKLNTEEFTMTGVEAWLQDLYTGTSQQLNLDGSAQDYEFDVDPTVSASSGNRFRIVFTNTALAVTNPEQGQLSIYPNPVTGGKVTVSLPTGNFEGCSYELINVLGQVVRQDIIEKGTTSQVSIPITGLPNSWYALRIRKDNKVVYQGKLIINN
ncbi:MAG: hypothetical protein RL699_1249 [Bacteroidota bacterium]|jgi:hypothetical protein